jgi:hypothetical protein
MDAIRLSHSQVVNLLVSNIDTETTTVVLGENGIGKTALMKSLQTRPELANHTFVPVVDCQNLDLGDHMIPVPDLAEGISRNLPNERYGIGAANHAGIEGAKPIVLCLDEIFKCKSYVQATLAPLFYDRRLGRFKLPKGSLVFGTSNLGVEGLGDGAPAHTRNRVEIIEMRKPNADEYFSWGVSNNMDAYMLAYVKNTPDVCNSFRDYKTAEDLRKNNPKIYNPYEQQEAYFSPRSGWRAAERLRVGLGKLDEDTLLAALIGDIGEPAARELWSVVSLHSEVIPFEEVVLDPKKARMGDNPIAQLVQVLQYIVRTENRQHAEAVCTYVRRMRGESQSIFCRSVSENLSKGIHYIRVAGFNEMRMEHNIAFAGGV